MVLLFWFSVFFVDLEYFLFQVSIILDQEFESLLLLAIHIFQLIDLLKFFVAKFSFEFGEDLGCDGGSYLSLGYGGDMPFRSLLLELILEHVNPIVVGILNGSECIPGGDVLLASELQVILLFIDDLSLLEFEDDAMSNDANEMTYIFRR